MKKLLQAQLKILARLIVAKYRPTVVGLTGSIGKTSAKDAVSLVLSSKRRVRTTFKNYNNEIGLPLTIIGRESPGRSLSGWLPLYAYALKLLVRRDPEYPEVLVLEMGVDHPGDMEYLTDIIRPDIGVVTAVSYAHIEYFGSVANIKKEKQVLIEKVPPKGLSVLNFDNDYCREMADSSQARVVGFGLKPGADLMAQDIVYNFTKEGYELSGVNFKLNYKGSIVPVSLPNVMSETSLYAALAAAAVALHFGFNLVEIARALTPFSLPKGRMNLLPGIKHSFIIDDTYNSSPEAALAALDVLRRVPVEDTAFKYAVLGDMLEIGDYSAEGHRLVGERVAKNEIDCLVAVGDKARGFIEGAREAGLDDGALFAFDTPEEAGDFLVSRLKAGDVILVKGSQGARMEKTVKKIMAEPERAAELIVRQGSGWEDR